MPFHRYHSITNTYSDKFLRKVEEEGYSLPTVEYNVTEKIHGANFAIYISNEHIQFASRSNLLGEGASFYNLQSIAPELKAKAQKLFDYHKAVNAGLDFSEYTLVVHGELFGGSYPGMPKTQKMVQKGVFYTNKLGFAVFDIGSISPNRSKSTESSSSSDEHMKPSYLLFDQCEMWDLANHAGFVTLPLLEFGTLEKCLKYSNEFNSGIPAILGMPELDKPNICEGVVITPTIPRFLMNGTRVIFKNKNEKFSEKTREPKVPKEPLSTELLTTITSCLAYITPQRLDNVLSKGPELDFENKRNIGVLMKAMTSDVFSEIADETDLLPGLDKEDRKEVNRAISNAIKPLVLTLF